MLKSTIKEIELTCEIVNERNTAFKNIFLWSGNETETVKMFGTLFGVDEGTKSPFALQQNVSKADKTETVNGKAAYLPQPVYPPAARAVKASGAVQVQVMIDELGIVISAKALTGHPLLRQAAEKAAKVQNFNRPEWKECPLKLLELWSIISFLNKFFVDGLGFSLDKSYELIFIRFRWVAGFVKPITKC